MTTMPFDDEPTVDAGDDTGEKADDTEVSDDSEVAEPESETV